MERTEQQPKDNESSDDKPERVVIFLGPDPDQIQVHAKAEFMIATIRAIAQAKGDKMSDEDIMKAMTIAIESSKENSLDGDIKELEKNMEGYKKRFFALLQMFNDMFKEE